jgi:Tol biopolymer transport system component
VTIASRILVLAAMTFAAAGLAGQARATYPGTNGQIAFYRGYSPTFDIYVANPDGTGERRVTSGRSPDWSPGGGRLAYVRVWNNEGHGGDIYTVNADGTGLTRLTVEGRWDDPAWSPDGTMIAATYHTPSCYQRVSGCGTRDDILLIDVASRSVILFANSELAEREPAWSPDGHKIAFSYFDHRSYGPRYYGIMVKNLNADGDEGKLKVSPNFGSVSAPDCPRAASSSRTTATRGRPMESTGCTSSAQTEATGRGS